MITYGMSETCGGCVCDGEPLQGVAVELADEGRIMIRSSTLFTGYRLRPDLTAETVVEGRLRTQDRGCWEAGKLVVLGRMDDIVITGGHKVDLCGRRTVRATVGGCRVGSTSPCLVSLTRSGEPESSLSRIRRARWRISRPWCGSRCRRTRCHAN